MAAAAATVVHPASLPFLQATQAHATVVNALGLATTATAGPAASPSVTAAASSGQSDRVSKITLGQYDQAMVFTQYLINNSLDNLWVQDGNRDTPRLTAFNVWGSSLASMSNVTMSSPRMILQTSGTTVIFQWRFNSGSLTLSYNPSGPPTPQTWDMKGWKIAYRLALGQSDVDSSSALYNQLRAKINQPGNYSITSIQLLPPAATSSFWASPEQGFSSYGNSGFENASFPYYNMFGGLLGQKIVEAGSNGLLLGGYVAKKSGDTTGTSLPPTFLPTGVSLQNYPFTTPNAQQTAGLTGNSRLNYLCFLEMTDGRPMPTGNNQAIPVNGNWTELPTATTNAGSALTSIYSSIQADSSQPGGWEVSNAVDNNDQTFWHSRYDPTDPLPHGVVIEFNANYLINGLWYLPRQDGSLNGHIGSFVISTSPDGGTFTTAASGTWTADHTPKQIFFEARNARSIRITAQSEAQGANYQWSSAAEFRVLSNALPRDSWSVSADSQETVDAGHTASSAIDGDGATYWHTPYHGASLPSFPHYFIIDQHHRVGVAGLSYLPRQDLTTAGTPFPYGRIGDYSIEYSNDNINWTVAATGTWSDDASIKNVYFTTVIAQYFRLVGKSEAGNRGPWATAGEIYLIDGAGQLPDFSSMDLATFAMSRTNFFERYLIPKLRCVNAAWEAFSNSLNVRIWLSGTLGSKLNYEWDPDNLNVGYNPNHWDVNVDPYYDFQRQKGSVFLPASKTAYMWSSSFDNGNQHDSVQSPSYQIWGNCSGSTTSMLTFTPGSNRIVINGATSIHLYCSVKNVGTTHDDSITHTCNWTLYLDLQSVNDGGLQISLTFPPISTSNTDSLDLKLLNAFPTYLESMFSAAASRFSSLEAALAADLAGTQKLILPASGSFFYKDPIINAEGDLLASVGWNGNDDGGANPEADPRKTVTITDPDPRPTQPPNPRH